MAPRNVVDAATDKQTGGIVSCSEHLPAVSRLVRMTHRHGRSERETPPTSSPFDGRIQTDA